jgi:uncharacterized SAM-binding protein YcdF (DUF218 family)
MAPNSFPHFDRHPSPPKRRKRRKLWRLSLLLLPFALPYFWLSYRDLENTWIEPDAIFVLGGETQREAYAAKFASRHPRLPVWISGGAPAGYTKKVFTKANIPLDRLHVDYAGVDTVTNFTSLVDRFQSEGITSVYLITSEDHIHRARAIGEIVFGSRGIKVKPIAFESQRPQEPTTKTIRDSLRSIVWLVTGYTGAK